jgi:hypothetical protein
MITVALWLIAGLLIAAVALLAMLMRHQEGMEKVLIAQLNGINATHLQGYEALTLSLRRAEGRIKKLEGRA